MSYLRVRGLVQPENEFFYLSPFSEAFLQALSQHSRRLTSISPWLNVALPATSSTSEYHNYVTSMPLTKTEICIAIKSLTRAKARFSKHFPPHITRIIVRLHDGMGFGMPVVSDSNVSAWDWKQRVSDTDERLCLRFRLYNPTPRETQHSTTGQVTLLRSLPLSYELSAGCLRMKCATWKHTTLGLRRLQILSKMQWDQASARNPEISTFDKGRNIIKLTSTGLYGYHQEYTFLVRHLPSISFSTHKFC